MKLNNPALDLSSAAYDDFQVSMPIMADLFKLNSLTLHYAYFVLTPMIVSVIYYATHKDDLRYVDALFMCFSAVTGTGIDVVDVSSQNSIQQGLLFALIIMGHAIPICGVLSLRRAWSLRAALRDDTCNNDMRCIIDADKEKVTTAVKELPPCLPSPTESETAQEDYGFITIVETTHDESAKEVSPKTVAGQKNPSSSAQSYILRVPASLRAMTQSVGEHVKQQRSIDYNQTGGVECLSVTLISILVIVYFLGFLCLGIVGIGVWSHVFRPDIAHAGGVSAFWGGSFLAVSALCNNGMSLITTNMGPFQREAFPLLTAGFLVLAGNTLFPCLLRLLVWVIRKFIPRHPEWNLWRQVLDHTLDQSQSVCDYLYPSWHTWFLLGTVIVLNCIMWIAFELSAIHNEEIGSLPPGYRILDGLFQALSVRGGGFSVVPFDQLGQGLLILYGLMMYLSAFPVSTTISNLESFRKSFSASPNGDDFNYAADKSNPHLSQFARARFVYQQLRSQFDNDMWWLCLAILLITVTESNNYKAHPLSFSTFNIIFEVISAYSCVGETMGFPGKSYAFSGEWHTFSKLLLIAVSLRGKIRSMPLKLESIDSHQKNMLDDLKCKN
ncbi:unnamed protein product [Penicillium salamii]|uniref:Cation transporter n=1 Tax=Penicillium salamii TaxID=1612424 RepID=A0A9W4K1K2_9EURO|nr:unnamed protein product [Penicillium salamii]CAG8101986.1 unnamed protein product [Penicillium salamii]CAG8292225.1 unnamed protein product [Penicillium salamii]CAG8321812.1 unnamed protein product [Penicillium salamii]CAG8418294.1 unnamed protein product [Penicillium salamii]